MDLLILIRKYSFYFVDKVFNKSKVIKHVENIESLYLSKVFDINKIKLLNELLLFFSTNSLFYKELEKTNLKLTDFPVLNKSIIKENYKNLKPKNDCGKVFSVVTSGSTGTPFSSSQNLNKKYRNTADTIFFGKKAGFEIGYTLFYFKVWNMFNTKSKVKFWMQNIIPFDVTKVKSNEMELILQKVKKKRDVAILSYSSFLDEIIKFFDSSDIQCEYQNVKSVIAMSEALTNQTKLGIKKYLDCEVISRYSNVENGILAQQILGKGDDFYVNIASYIIEVLKIDSNEYADIGESGRIVVTDLFNYSTPFIRYDTGDIGIVKKFLKNTSFALILERIEGRKMDVVYDVNGNLVSSFTITNNMWNYPEIKQYQFIQTGRASYKFIINSNTEFKRGSELIDEFKLYFGEKAKITIEYIDEIPLLNSGKRKKVKNIYG